MPEHAPARWFSRRPTGDAADVLVPVVRSEPDEWAADLAPGRVAWITHGPGDVSTPPGSVTVTAEEPTMWLGRREAPRMRVAVILRVAATEWDALHASVAERGLLRPLTDQHTGVEWRITEWDPSLTGACATADPPDRYEVRWPPPWGDVRHRDTCAVLDTLTGPPHDPFGIYPLHGWTVHNPYREDQP